MMKLVIALELKRVNFPIFRRLSVEKPSASLRSALKIFQNKKKKKRKPFVEVEGFKKASFFEKILPDTSPEVRT